MFGRWFGVLAGLLVTAPLATAGVVTGPGDFVEVRLVHGQPGVGENGVLVVVPPGGHALMAAGDGLTCNGLGEGCGTRVTLPPGTNAGGVWEVSYAPQRPHNLLTSVCYLLVPTGPPGWGYWCVASGPWPDAPYLQYDLSLSIAGWSASGSIRCATATGAAWALAWDARQVTATCARYPVV